MNIRPRTALAILAGLGALTGLLVADLPEIESMPALMPAEQIAAPSTPSPATSQELLGERQPVTDPMQAEAEELARNLARALEAQPAAVPSSASPRSSWERMQPEIDRRFANLDATGRRANIAFVHFLFRNGLEPESLSDELLARSFDELAELHATRDRELHGVQYEDGENGTAEQIQGPEVDELSMELMNRYREREQELGRRFGGTDQRSAGAAAFASASNS